MSKGAAVNLTYSALKRQGTVFMIVQRFKMVDKVWGTYLEDHSSLPLHKVNLTQKIQDRYFMKHQRWRILISIATQFQTSHMRMDLRLKGLKKTLFL